MCHGGGWTSLEMSEAVMIAETFRPGPVFHLCGPFILIAIIEEATSLSAMEVTTIYMQTIQDLTANAISQTGSFQLPWLQYRLRSM